VPKYEIEYVLETVHLLTVEAESEDEAVELANEIDLADWEETDSTTLDVVVREVTD
jgi:hypothetical protein